MKININLDILAYEEEKLRDDVFDDAPGYGIQGPEVIAPLGRKRNSNVVYIYNEKTTARDAIDRVKSEIWGSPDYRVMAPVSYSFLVNGERLFINDDRRLFSKLLADYIDPERTGSITVCVLVSCNAGEVASEWPLRYYMRSRESGSHHEAHVHVRDSAHRYEASVRISDGEVIVGELPRKLAKIAKEKILSDQAFFYNCWTTMTDGLSVDINHHYGYIQY